MQTCHSAVHVMHGDQVVSAGLHAILAVDPALRVSLERDGPQARQAARVLVTDYQAGLALARAMADGAPGAALRAGILVVTQRDLEWDVRTALDAGVHGYLLQSCSQEELRRAVAALAGGQRYLGDTVTRRVADSLGRETLTGRETDVLQLLAEGCCNKAIARRLGIGVGTVKTHVKGVMSKLDATARTHAVVVAARRGLIHPGSSV